MTASPRVRSSRISPCPPPPTPASYRPRRRRSLRASWALERRPCLQWRKVPSRLRFLDSWFLLWWFEQYKRSAVGARVENVAQAVGDEIDADHGEKQRDPGKKADPVVARQQIVETVGDEQAQRWLRDRQPEAQKRERRLERDRCRHLDGREY